MIDKQIKKIMLLLIVTTLLLGITCAAETNKTSTTKDTKVVKDTNKAVKTEHSKNIKTLSKKANTTTNTIKTTKKETKKNITKKNINNTKNTNQSLKSSYYYYPQISVKSKTVYGKTTYLEAKIKYFDEDEDYGTVDFYINGTKIGTKTAHKNVKLKYTFKNYGTYDYYAVYDDYYYGKDYSNDATIKVKAKYDLWITSPNTILANQKATFKFKIYNQSSLIKTGKFKIKLNGKTIATKNMYNGNLKFTYKMPKKPGTYKITAEFYKNNKKIQSLTIKRIVKAQKWGNYIFGEKITYRFSGFLGDSNLDYLGTAKNIYIHNRLTGYVYKRVLHGGVYTYDRVK